LIRATELCERVGDRQELLGLLFQSGQFYLERSRWGEARPLAERAIALAQDAADRIHEAAARHNLAESFVWSGDPLAAKPQCEKALELLATAAPELLISSFGFDLWMLSSALGGLVELLLGRPDHSLETEDRLLERAGSSSHRYSRAFGIFLVCSISTVRRHLGKVLAHARTAYETSEEYGFAELLNWALWSEGYARFWQGEREVGLAQQKRAMQELEALGSRIFSSWRMAWLAEAQVQIGEIDAANSSLEQASSLVQETGERWVEPEIHRIAAEAILSKVGGDVLAAQRRFEEAVAIAQKQSSKWWELRATVSLVRLLAKQGRRDEARTMLADIYNWFTEGFDTADLKDAKALLGELNG
jgi:tetratricopeptide (TPR) repeat protein